MQNFPKIEKLCSKTLIDKLFEKKQKITKYPLTLFWIETELLEKVSVQSTVTVSKRRFKKAVTRNLLKRRIREAFRLNKYDYLYQQLENQNKQLAIMIVYQSNDILKYSEIESAMLLLLKKLSKRIDHQKSV
ncbi:MAG: ribonuclease P protein component [Bacteroidetes bacterium 4572_117]|nr:MAG: ribonuclease P protein component [Bacteroidetes bacterium 4572_117]